MATLPDQVPPDSIGCAEIRIDVTLDIAWTWFSVEAEIFDPTGERVGWDYVSGDGNSSKAQVLTPDVCDVAGAPRSYRVELRYEATYSTSRYSDFARTTVLLGETAPSPPPLKQTT